NAFQAFVLLFDLFLLLLRFLGFSVTPQAQDQVRAGATILWIEGNGMAEVRLSLGVFPIFKGQPAKQGQGGLKPRLLGQNAVHQALSLGTPAEAGLTVSQARLHAQIVWLSLSQIFEMLSGFGKTVLVE